MKSEIFAEYSRNRAEYFRRGDPTYYGSYFTRLGNSLAFGFYGKDPPEKDKASTAQNFFADYVAKFDILPWWSTKIDHIDPVRVTLDVEPIRAWRKVLDSAVSFLKPRAIVINGCGWRQAVEGLFSCTLKLFHYETKSGANKHAYRSTVNGIPLIVHP